MITEILYFCVNEESAKTIKIVKFLRNVNICNNILKLCLQNQSGNIKIILKTKEIYYRLIRSEKKSLPIGI